MSQEQGRSKPSTSMVFLSREELALKARVDASYFFLNFMPLCIFSNITLRHFINKGTIKVKRPGLVYAAATITTYIFSKYLAFKELKRQMLINFPDGIYAQTRNMNRAQITEYLDKKQLEFAKKKLEDAGMTVVEDPTAQSHSTSDSGQESSSHSSQPSGYSQGSSPQPLERTTPGILGDEKMVDPPSKLRPKRKNKYGDEME